MTEELTEVSYRILKAVAEAEPSEKIFGKVLARKIFECKTDPPNPSRYWQGAACRANSLANRLVSIGYLFRVSLPKHCGHTKGYYALTSDGRRVLDAYVKRQEERDGEGN